ncbi:aminoglycoside phosphotransferase family protein [Paenibacillus sp. CAA11]|uniref:phosphotransferase family protein n=1 Tax=Paenibacillus sp. CAA11 TaxID=1532905 RepID=UPI000D334CB5|nr:aminoglycoside phosphotransferase family protein [Paenibacillus sp. CAA11]AWB45474.1 aminoglycoside phosphotransferase family protein [Paenibacillus sp. CAA11]
MHSKMKRALQRSELELMVAQSFGPAVSVDDVRFLEDGWFNTACLIQLSGGKEVVLKVGPPPEAVTMRYEQGIMGTEVEVLRLIQEAGVPAPEVYDYNTDRTILDGEYFFMQKLPGEPYNKIKESLSAEQRETVEQELGRLNKMINEIQGDRFGSPAAADRRYGDWPSAFFGMMEDLMKDAEESHTPLPASSAEILKLVHKQRGYLEEVLTPKLVHWDLWDGNLFVEEDRISGIIDCERALWGDPLMEHYFRRFADSRAFHQGYGKLDRTPGYEARKLLYDLYLDLILHIECVFRDYENDGHRKWAKDNLWASWQQIANDLK